MISSHRSRLSEKTGNRVALASPVSLLVSGDVDAQRASTTHEASAPHEIGLDYFRDIGGDIALDLQDIALEEEESCDPLFWVLGENDPPVFDEFGTDDALSEEEAYSSTDMEEILKRDEMNNH